MNEYSDVVYASSLLEPNTWFIFRPNGIEVKLVIVDYKITSNKELTAIEVDFLKINICSSGNGSSSAHNNTTSKQVA